MRTSMAVTSLDSFAYYKRSESMTLKAYVKDILRMRPQTEAMRKGIAVEDALMRMFQFGIEPDVLHHVFPSKVDADLLRPDAMQVPCHTDYQIGSDTVTLRGRVDAVSGLTVVDWKTTSSQIDVEKYAEALQWRCYLDGMRLPRFRYEIFRLDKKGVPADFMSFALMRYSGMTDHIRSAIADYLEFLKGLERDDIITLTPRGVDAGEGLAAFLEAEDTDAWD